MAPLSIPARSDTAGGRRLLRDLDRRLERFDRAILVAEWNLYTGRSRRGADAWELRRSALLSDDRLLGWARTARTSGWSIGDRRRLDLLGRILLDARVEQHPDVVRRRGELQRRIVAFRPRWNGRRVNRALVHRVLRLDPDPEQRRRAFYALEPLYRPMEAAVQELVRTRNERARLLGYRTFAEMRLGFQGMTVDRLDELARKVAEGVPPRARQMRARMETATPDAGWHPWDFSFAREQIASLPEAPFPVRSMLPTILSAVRQWGFRTERMRFQVVFHDLPAGGQSLAPDPPTDVRIQVHPQGGWHAYRVMFHEVGHAVHSASIRAPRHLLRWHENVPGFGGFHEGIAALFEEIPRSARWLATQRGIGAADAQAFETAWKELDLLDAAHTVSWMRVEQALYRAPQRDPAEDARRFDRRLFGYDDYPAPSFVDAFWVDAPVYAPNYLLAATYHYQLARTLRERFGEPLWPNPRVGPWLAREWFAPGSLYDWVPRVRRLTGRPFGAEALRDAFSSLPAPGG
ncbi:MAG: M3 family metallopeptidase [Thermoplasmata archaeon]|nr:M3 family metallopeptidase [Thermoplasmata archaeon]